MRISMNHALTLAFAVGLLCAAPSAASATTIYSEDFQGSTGSTGNTTILPLYDAFTVNTFFVGGGTSGVLASGTGFPVATQWLYLQAGLDSSGNKDLTIPGKGLTDDGDQAVFIDTGASVVDGASYSISLDLGGSSTDNYGGTYTIALYASAVATDQTDFDPTLGSSTLIGSFTQAGPGSGVITNTGLTSLGTGTGSGSLFVAISMPDATTGNTLDQGLIDNIVLDEAMPPTAPEPSAFVLAGLGLIGLSVRRRRRKRRA